MANSDGRLVRISGRSEMASDPKLLASKVVESFKSLLDNEARDAVSEHQFHALQGMVREALADPIAPSCLSCA